MRRSRFLVFIVSEPVIDCVDLGIHIFLSSLFENELFHINNTQVIFLISQVFPTFSTSVRLCSRWAGTPLLLSLGNLLKIIICDGFLMQNLYLEAAASSLGLLGRKLKQLFNSQHCFGSTSCWRLDRTASAFSDTLELFVSQSCEEFSGRACAACHVSDGKRRRFPTWQSPLQAPQSPPPTRSEVLQTSLCTPPPDQQVIAQNTFHGKDHQKFLEE